MYMLCMFVCVCVCRAPVLSHRFRMSSLRRSSPAAPIVPGSSRNLRLLAAAGAALPPPAVSKEMNKPAPVAVEVSRARV